MRSIKKIFFSIFSIIDQQLKFPGLKKGETGIQVGFDMTSQVTSDLFEMSRKAGKKGLVLGIDPDNWNHDRAKEIIENGRYTNITLIQCGTFSHPTKANFLFGRKASWSQIGNIAIDETVEFSGEEMEIQLETLDNILREQNIDIEKIGHVNITNNGAEYFTLLGFQEGLKNIQDLALTVVAGRHDASGTIDGKPDFELILDFLHRMGFKTKFRRIHQLFWWGFVVKLLINRNWIYNKQNYGIIFAAKGKKKIPFYQSFS